jgi:hypothetical protein
MNRLALAGVMLLALVTAVLAGPAAPSMGFKASPPLVFKATPPSGSVRNAKPANLPASGSKNDALFRQFLDWRKKQTQ